MKTWKLQFLQINQLAFWLCNQCVNLSNGSHQDFLEEEPDPNGREARPQLECTCLGSSVDQTGNFLLGGLILTLAKQPFSLESPRRNVHFFVSFWVKKVQTLLGL
jgi:hypothetical protein